MHEQNCHVCGGSIRAGYTFCSICGSQFTDESGNPYTGGSPIQRKPALIVGLAAVVAFVLSAVTVGVAGTQVSQVLASSFGSLLPSGQADDLLPDTNLGINDGSTDDSGDTGTDFTDDSSGTDDGSSDGGTYISGDLSLTDKQIAEGYTITDDGGLAWRWANESEKSGLYCANGATVCGWVKVVALRDCPAVLLNLDLSSSQSSNNMIDTLVGYGNDNIDSSEMYQGDIQIIEADTWSDHSGVSTWVYMNYLGCESSGIGHD